MYKVIDISVNQSINSIDFEAIKESGVKGVIVRAGYGNTAKQKDSNFEVFIDKAKQAGHKVGAYWFCYARNEAEAIHEAEAFSEVLASRSLDYPVVYDIEGDTVRYMQDNGITPTKEFISNIAIAFCDTMQKYGYNTMLYSNKNFVEQYFDERLTKYPLWVAMYPGNPNINEQFTMDNWNVIGWQYTSTNAGINGAPSHLDVSVFYDDNSDYNESEETNMTREQAEICINTCFIEHLDRLADPSGLEAYVNVIIDRDFDCDLSDIDNALMSSDEYKNKKKREFIVNCYRNLLGREPESEDVIQARMGYRLRDIFAEIVSSEEYRNKKSS